MKLNKSERKQVFGMFGGKCAYCGCDLPEKGWHADHVEAVHRRFWEKGSPIGRPECDTIANIFPACIPCNIHKHCTPLEEWREYLLRQTEIARRNSAPFRHAERFGRVTTTDGPLVFWFEKCVAQEMTSDSPYLIPPQVESAHPIEFSEDFWIGDEWWPLNVKATEGER